MSSRFTIKVTSRRHFFFRSLIRKYNQTQVQNFTSKNDPGNRYWVFFITFERVFSSFIRNLQEMQIQVLQSRSIQQSKSNVSDNVISYIYEAVKDKVNALRLHHRHFKSRYWVVKVFDDFVELPQPQHTGELADINSKRTSPVYLPLSCERA